MRLVREVTTERQRQIIEGLLAGKTQLEIAKSLGVKSGNATITKSLHGNVEYNTKYHKRRSGGAIKKLRAAAARDPEIQELRRQLIELG